MNPQVGFIPMELEYEQKDLLTQSMLTMTGIIGQKLDLVKKGTDIVSAMT